MPVNHNIFQALNPDESFPSDAWCEVQRQFVWQLFWLRLSVDGGGRASIGAMFDRQYIRLHNTDTGDASEVRSLSGYVHCLIADRPIPHVETGRCMLDRPQN